MNKVSSYSLQASLQLSSHEYRFPISASSPIIAHQGKPHPLCFEMQKSWEWPVSILLTVKLFQWYVKSTCLLPRYRLSEENAATFFVGVEGQTTIRTCSAWVQHLKRRPMQFTVLL